MRRLKTTSTVQSCVAILLLVAFALISLERFHTAAIAETRGHLDHSMRTFRELLGHKGTGFSIADGKLLAGDYPVNGNFEVTDKIQAIFGDTATIFQGDLRVATNVLRADGTRAVGTRLEGPAYDAIFRQGRPFGGETLILGTPYLTSYEPIRDARGRVIGALYVGMKKSEFQAHYSLLQKKLLLTLLGFLALFLTFVILYYRVTKRAERDKVDDLKFLQALIDAIPNPIYYKNFQGRLQGGNRAFAEFTGFSVAEMTGKTSRELAPGSQAQRWHEADQELLRTQRVRLYEAALADARGGRHEVVIYQAPFPAAGGSPAGMIGTMLDITERKKAETELAESRQYLSDIIEFYPDAVMVIDRDRKVVTWNRAMEEVSGVPAQEMLGKGGYEYAIPFYGQCRPMLIDLVLFGDAQAMEGYAAIEARGSTLVGEAYIHNARGETLYFNGTAAALRNSAGEVIGAIESIRDVTARRRAEEQVELKNLILTTQQECTLDGILVVDEALAIISHNRRFSEMWGIPASLLEAGDYEPILQFLATRPTDPAGFLERVRHLYGHRDEKSQEEIALKDGRVFDRYSAPLTGANGKYYGRVWYFRDVTDLLRAKDDLLRTQKLESLGVLAGGIAHDFNNILTAILGNITLARLQVHEPEKVAKSLESAEQAATRAKDLTRQLLTFARGGKPVKKVFQIGPVLKEAAGFAVVGCAVKCLLRLDDDLWPVQADEGQLSQVIHNLVLNAVQATPEGGTVTLAAQNAATLPDRGRMLEISVTDTGSGIAEEILQKIFDPYFTTKAKGSGLGLATSYAIIKNHNGELSVDSALGRGSSFHIRLPAAGGAAISEPDAFLKVARGQGRVLVMDDEEMVRKITQTSLEELGYQVECTENGNAAVELYRRRKQEGTPFMTVFMDLTVAGGTGGREAISQLLRIDPKVKAVVCSGYGCDPIMANYRKYGFSAALVKPYRLEEVGRVLQQLHDC